ncbi:MAG: hypothetical protein H0Z28_08695 [Archaeoglobus sp.]|nr:hypothetical protein [Archaeoglobus sp.]
MAIDFPASLAFPAFPLFSVLSSTIFLSIFAIAISLNFRISKFLNLSHGSIFAMGAYFAYYTLESNVALGVVAAIITAFFLGAILYLLIKKIGNGIFEATIISLGFAIGLEETLRIIHGKGYYLIVESTITDWEAMQALLLVVLLSSIFAAYSSRIGIRIKFVEDDEFLAKIYGVNYDKYSFLCITLTSSAIALLGFLSSTSQALYPGIGWIPLIAGIIIAAFTALFRSVGFMHYGKIVLLSFAYSSLVALLFG